MELYEIKEKVGSDPCLVLDFEFAMDAGRGGLVSNIKHFETLDEAKSFINELSALLKSLAETRCVIFNGSVTGLFNGASLCTSTVLFNIGNDNVLYTFFVSYLPMTETTFAPLPVSITYGATDDSGYDVYWLIRLN